MSRLLHASVRLVVMEESSIMLFNLQKLDVSVNEED